MPEENKEDKKDDVVKAEDYNKVVENANSLKVDKEKIEKELKELKEAQEAGAKKLEDDKKAWEEEKKEKDKAMEDLKNKAEEKVSKGLVKEPKKTDLPATKIKETLDKEIPDDDFDPKRVGSNLARYGHYKNPTTKKYTDEQLGMGLDLNRGAKTMDPGSIPNEARTSKNDLVL